MPTAKSGVLRLSYIFGVAAIFFQLSPDERGISNNFTVPYSEKNSFITASSRFFRFSSGVLWLSYISDCWTDPPDFTYTFTKNRLTRLRMLQVTALGPILIGLYSKEQGDRTLSRTAQQEHIISGPNIGMIRHVHHEHIHAHASDNRTDISPAFFFFSRPLLVVVPRKGHS